MPRSFRHGAPVVFLIVVGQKNPRVKRSLPCVGMQWSRKCSLGFFFAAAIGENLIVVESWPSYTESTHSLSRYFLGFVCQPLEGFRKS